jgi:hypothetical protein
MAFKRLRIFSFTLLLLVFLVACGNNQGITGPQFSEADFGDAAKEMNNDAAVVMAAAFQNPGFVALDALFYLNSPLGITLPGPAPVEPPEGPLPEEPFDRFMLTPLAVRNAVHVLSHTDSDLPRGTFIYNDMTGEWDGAPTGTGNLVLQYSYVDYATDTMHQGELVVDWDVASGTTAVNTGYGTVEVPTDMNLTLRADGTKVADLDIAVTWYEAPACGGPIFEPSSLAVTGTVGDSTSSVAFDMSLGLTDRPGTSDLVATQGEVTFTAGADTARIDWNVSMNGTMSRDSACFLNGLNINNGNVDITTSTTVEGETTSFQIAFDFDDVVPTEYGEVRSVAISNGVIKVDGTLAVTFSGTLDDADEDSVPGENLNLVFAGGRTTTLEAFIMEHNVMPMPEGPRPMAWLLF